MSAAAFFDVDETLISTKSMFSFLEFFLAAQGEPAGTYRREAALLRGYAAAGAPRAEVNRRYYRLYAGQSARRVAQVGRDWFAARQSESGFFHQPVRAALDAHRDRGPVYLVSGSFFACLDPIGAQVKADGVIGTRPVVRRGELTGQVLVPVIGATKGRVVAVLAALRGLSLPASSVYGDHASDVSMLELVGDPVVVGADPVLRARAARSGWRTLAVDPAEKEAA